MGRVLVLVILAFAIPVAISGQTLVVLHIRGSLTDASGQARPLARHVLLISDEPQTQETRKIVTSIDGTADVRLRPGHYVVESDQPIALQGQAYRWRQTLDIVAGRVFRGRVAHDGALGLVRSYQLPGTVGAITPIDGDDGWLLAAGRGFVHLAPDGERPGATASRARLAAALNLARAGYKEDARAQFEWVIRHSRDAGEREVARKAQAKL